MFTTQVLLLLTFIAPLYAEDVRVTSLTPTSGSLNGETRITIYGTGFAKNQFNPTGDESIGNRVELVSGTQSLECPVHLDGSHETQIMCYTPRGMPADYWQVRVSVDGERIPDDKHCNGNTNKCRFQSRGDKTPKINRVYPMTNFPAEVVQVNGLMFTDKFETTVEAGCNGNEERILRVYFNSRLCEIRVPDANDEYYGMGLDEDCQYPDHRTEEQCTQSECDSNWGYLKCLTTGTYVGNQNASFIVSGPYGRSQPELDTYHVTAQNEITMYQTYAGVTGLSTSTGSTLGGTHLTIHGNYFDETDAPAVVTVGGQPCEVLELDDKYIVCETSPQPNNITFEGNRGVFREEFGSRNNIERTVYNLGLEAITNFTDPDNVTFFDALYWSEVDGDYFSTRHRGYIVPPSDNDYRFYVKGDDFVQLYLSNSSDPDDKELVAYTTRFRSTYFEEPTQKSERMTLKGGEKYYYEVLHREATGGQSVSVAMHMYDTVYTSIQASNVRDERQTISSSSTVTNEEFSFGLEDWSTQSSVSEVQLVDVTSVSNMAYFRLGMHGVYTERLSIEYPASYVANALNKLPSITPATVSVTDQSIAGGTRYTITINGDGGNWPDFDVISAASEEGDKIPVDGTVTELISGRPSMNYYKLSYNGLPTKPIHKDASANTVATALEDMFQVSCPSFITSPSSRLHYFDYESYPSTMQWMSGTRVYDVTPFCGRYSLKNPTFLFIDGGDNTFPINARTAGHLCFAYRGQLQPKYDLHYTWSDGSDDSWGAWRSFEASFPVESGWGYTCIDMYAGLLELTPSLASAYIHRIVVYRATDDDLYVDDVYIGGRQVVTENNWEGVAQYQRLVPPRWFMDDITVTGDSSMFHVTLQVLNCEDNLPLLAVSHAQVQSGASTHLAAYRDNGWPSSAQITVSRTQTASPPLAGTFDIHYRDQSVNGISATVDADTLKAKLETLAGVGTVDVTRTGICSGYNWRVDFISGASGDHPQFEVDDSAVTGTEVAVTVGTNRDGGVFFDPIMGDTLRTFHELPQVTVMINNIPSRCVGNCSFSWEVDATPSLTSINPTTGSVSAGTSLTLTGAGFSTMNNTVTIGNVECDITVATETQIECDIGEGPAGSHEVVVNVGDKGLAEHVGGPFEFTYEFLITGINPDEGSTAGGTKLNVTGTGFGEKLNVTVNGELCDIIYTSYDLITCATPAGSGTVDVAATDGINSHTSSTQFTYQSSLTPQASSLSDTAAAVEGGSVISIGGIGFGSSAPGNDAVIIGNKTAEIMSWSSNSIEVELPALAPGDYPLKLQFDEGLADTTSLSDISYTLEVTDMSPDSGSLYGGTTLTLTGTGFSNATEVKVGGVTCEVMEYEDSELVCVTGDSAVEHEVTNLGAHPTYGTGYAWKPNPLTVQVGDSVKWRWGTPELVTGIGYRVEQTVNETSTIYRGSGFRSSTTNTANGAFTYKFTSPGTYYYWSGCVDQSCNIAMRGTIKVQPDTSFAGDLQVKVAEYEATYDTALMTGKKRRRRSVCSEEESVLDSCVGSTPEGADQTRFSFAYWACSTPTIDSITPNQGTSMELIEIYGSGFGTSECQNEVTIGGQECVVQESSYTSINCTLNPGDSLQIGVPFEVVVNVNNRGRALSTITDDLSRRFTLLPHVMTVDPSTGSTAGGTLITIHGDGFSQPASSTTVTIAGTSCSIESLMYDTIVCRTSNAFATSEEIVVTVSSNGNAVPAVCEGACDFTYQSSITPMVDSISPTTITAASTEVTITGTNFGTTTSDVEVSIGGELCTVISVSDTEIIINAGEPVVGNQPLVVRIDNVGLASQSVSSITVDDVITSLSPASGSVVGGTLLTVVGLGFDNETQVSVGGNPCTVISVSRVEIICESPAAATDDADSSVTASVTSNSITYSTTPAYDYLLSQTPTISSISPASASSGDTLTFTGSSFGSTTSDVTVTIGDATCTITSVSDTTLACDLGDHSAGTYNPVVHISGKGFASGSSDVPFTYELTIDSVDPATGSFGGGQLLTLTGKGFDEETTNVTVCGELCELKGSPSATQLYCETPANSGSSSMQVCDIIVAVGTARATDSSAYTYDTSLTPTISSVDPVRGGTGGGTLITISGAGFGTNQADINVTIAGTECDLQSLTNTEITCRTGAHKPSVETKVRVEVGTSGIATQDSADFQYIDVWSSIYTWGGTTLPEEGDLVVIPNDMTVLLDISTPVFTMILIQGGKLIFDEVDVELQAENILITDGGVLQVGTEDEPFQHKATITMHGHVRSKELPIYGTKTIAVREGKLELHGKPRKTWTLLAATADAGATTIELLEEVDWEVGDQIVIATTGKRHSQIESEVRNITAISGGTTLTLDQALEYKHLGETIDYGFDQLEARAEVGLLSRNVVVRGDNDPQWNDKIEACEAGFDTGEFATQTCFQGRFGEEIGSDQYGSQIMLHAPRPDEGLVEGHIENIEVTYAGQAFRLGRYAIHFHLNGNMSGSYVRGCSIHKSFNRAVNVHGTHNVLLEHNVVYDIMGGAFFTEDGIETENIFQYNLAIFVRSSTSLQNDDITPAAYWITNPNNIVRHNRAAGGTHFGFWYRMHDHPDGPSFDPNVCPRKVPLAEFYNNTVHSQGWFGVWIFQHFYPTVDGACGGSTPVPADFNGLTTWNCEKGAETVGGGAIQFTNFKFVNNDVCGYEFKLIGNVPAEFEFTDEGPLLANGFITSDGSGVLDDQVSRAAIIMPYQYGFKVSNVTFVDFSSSSRTCLAFTSITGKTETYNGAFEYMTEGLNFVNSESKVGFRWAHEAVIHDLDGTLTGTAGGKVVPTDGTLPDVCEDFNSLTGFPASYCPPEIRFHRFAWNNAIPQSLVFKDVNFRNRYGNTTVPFTDKAVTHPKGWRVLLVDQESYIMEWVDANQITNISYTGVFYRFHTDDFVIMGHNFTQRADHFEIFPNDNRNESLSQLSAASLSGDWFFDDDANKLDYIISSKTKSNPTGERSLRANFGVDLDVFQCYYAACIPPPDVEEIPPPDNRPSTAVFWSQKEAWSFCEEGYGCYDNGDYNPPADDTDVKINADVWMVVDTDLPRINKLYIYGVLEFENALIDGEYKSFTLSATHILISGGRLIVGWEDNPFKAQAVIELRGDHFTPELPLPNGPNLGAKALGVFGGLDLHGLPVNITWTQLASSASVGDRSITVRDPVDWTVGDQIVIAPTSYQYNDSEVVTITAINDRTLTLDRALQFPHYAVEETVGGGRSYLMAAEVGLLTHNVKIVGQEYGKLYKEAFGARVLVGTYEWIDAGGIHTFTGYARISNVEFYHSGQEGWTDEYDPRFSLAYLNTGDVVEARPSYAKRCSFNNGFAPAIGVFGANGLTIEDNVVFKTVGSSFQIEGIGHKINHNLLTHLLFPGSFNDRNELRFEFDAGIEIQETRDIEFTHNHVAGSQRAGIRTSGERCLVTEDQQLRFTGNVAHSSLVGVIVMPPNDGFQPCSALNNFTVYRNWDFGLYAQTPASIKVHNLVSIDNGVGFFPMVIRPPSASHLVDLKFVELHNSVFVGSSSAFDCDESHPTDTNFGLSESARSFRSPSGGQVGVSTPTFSSKDNTMPKKPFLGIKAYQAIAGVMKMYGNTFSKFGKSCGDRENVAVMSNPFNEDGIHPIKVWDTQFYRTPATNRMFLSRPNVGTINPADCVDMNCDGLKKAILRDEDGSFLGEGSSGAIIAESEWQWDADPRYGLGDYRIPKVMLTDLEGNRIPVEEKCPNKGIYRDDSCVYREAYQGWECHGPDYEMLMLESMDSDTETRRVSPVAVYTDSYVDLVNGPQDHGWCMGYTCQKRLSTFPIILASGKEYEIYFTGTTPQNLRYHWLNTDNSQSVLVGVWYAQPWRLDVYVDGVYFMPTNGQLNDDFQLVLDAPPDNNPRYYMPNVNTDVAGVNYFDRATSTLWLVLRGPVPVNVVTVERIVVTFDVPAMTVDEFFGENIVNNLAAFLDIPPEKIRYAEAVSETGRRKRSDVQTVTITIENPPRNSTSNGTDFDIDPSDISASQMYNISSLIVSTYQLGDLADVLNITIISITITEPAPPTDSEQWTIMAVLEVSGEVTLQVPDDLELTSDPVPIHEGAAFSTQPALKMIDIFGAHVAQVGSVMDPWVVNASLVMIDGSDTDASLLGSTTASFLNGWANFSDLAISHSGHYKLEFTIVYPTEASHFSVQSESIELDVRALSGAVVMMPNETYSNETTEVQIEVIDAVTLEKVLDVDWKGHSYACSASLYNSQISPGQLVGTTTASIDTSTGIATYDDLVFSSPGHYYLQFRCISSPALWDFTFISEVFDVSDWDYVMPDIEVTKRVQLRFSGDYDTVANGEETYIGSAVYNYFWNRYPQVIHRDFTVYEGSIMVNYYMDGTEDNVTDVHNAMWEDLKAGVTITYNGYVLTAYQQMWVDGESFYGLDGPPASEGSGLEGWVIAVIAVVVGLVILAIVVAVAVYKYKHPGRAGEKLSSISPMTSRTDIHSARSEKHSGVIFIDDFDCEKLGSKDVQGDDASSSGVSSQGSGDSRPSTGSRVIIPRSAPLKTVLPDDTNWQRSNTGMFSTNAADPLPPYTEAWVGNNNVLRTGNVGSTLPQITK